MYSVLFTSLAEKDLKSCLTYIDKKLKNKPAALSLLDEVNSKIKIFSENPKLYPLVKDSILAARGFRCMRIKNYLIFYVRYDSSVSIIRFLYTRRDRISIL